MKDIYCPICERVTTHREADDISVGAQQCLVCHSVLEDEDEE